MAHNWVDGEIATAAKLNEVNTDISGLTALVGQGLRVFVAYDLTTPAPFESANAFFLAGGFPIIRYNGMDYACEYVDASGAQYTAVRETPINGVNAARYRIWYLDIEITGGSVTSVARHSYTRSHLSTVPNAEGRPPASVFTPTENNHPANKKYVDDQKAAIEAEMLANYITDTALGNPATFPDGADDIPVKDLKVAITALQDLHGYTKPWAAGCGKNVLPPLTPRTSTINDVTWTVDSAGIITAVGLASADSTFYLINNGSLALDGTYTITLPANINGAIYVDGTWHPLAQGASTTITVNGTAQYMWVQVQNGVNANATIYPMIELGSTATPYEPYENICPIIGWTESHVTRTGANVWNEQWENGALDYTTGQDASGPNQLRSGDYVRVIGGEEYYFYTPTSPLRVYCFDESKTLIPGVGGSTNFALLQGQTFTVPASCAYIRFCTSQNYVTYADDISINYPSTDTAYHAYSGTTIIISWQDEAGTVYGGSLDVTTGVLTVGWAIEDMGSLYWVYLPTQQMFYTIGLNHKAGAFTLLCSTYATASTTSWANIDNGQIVGNTLNNTVYVKDTAYSDAPTFTNAVRGQHIVYELATPTTYQLTAEEVATYLGRNNFSSDTGAVEVEYRADTKLYIAKVVGQ